MVWRKDHGDSESKLSKVVAIEILKSHQKTSKSAGKLGYFVTITQKCMKG